MSTWLVLDATYLCHRAFRALGELQYDNVQTGVAYGLFRDINVLKSELDADRIVFCFDRGKPLRKSLCDTYKGHRDKLTPEEIEIRQQLRKQMAKLCLHILPALGFRNVFSQKGYEADDLIAATCERIPKPDKAVIISADADLHQLLSDRISFYNPRKKELLTKQKFEELWGIDPTLWADVKAIAGCTSDDVKGVDGVGEKTAVKFLAGTLPTHHKAFDKIVMGSKIKEFNLKLVRLPFPGTQIPDFQEDEVTMQKWKDVARRLGIRSIRGIFA